MSDLAAFLRARLTEDEAAAKGAIAEPARYAVCGDEATGEWRINPNHDSAVIDDAGSVPIMIIYSPKTPVSNVHIARHDPARVLREVEAKRKILAEHADTVGGVWIDGHGHDNEVCARCVESDRDGDYCAEEPGPCVTLRALAAVYSDHPDYDPAWA